METKNYLSLYTHYYDALNATAPADELDFFMQYARAAQGAILEPMCGSGRFLIPLAQAGFKIDGFDASPFMLEKLHTKCTALDITQHVWFNFLQDLHRSERYALIFIPSGSFNLLLTDAEIEVSLQKIYEHLQPGGTFVVELITVHEIQHALTNIWRESVQKITDDAIIIAHHMDLPVHNTIGTTIMRYDLVQDNAIIKTEIEEFTVRFYQDNEMDSFLKTAGFKNIKKVKAFAHGQMPDSGDEIIVYECTK